MPSSDIHTNFITLKLKFAEQVFYLFRNDNSIAFNAIRNKLLDFFFLNECCRHLKFLFFISEKNHWRKCLQRHAIYKKWSISFNIFIHLQIYYLHRGDAHTSSVFKSKCIRHARKPRDSWILNAYYFNKFQGTSIKRSLLVYGKRPTLPEINKTNVISYNIIEIQTTRSK